MSMKRETTLCLHSFHPFRAGQLIPDLELSDPRLSCAMVNMGSCLVVAGGSHQTVEVLDTKRNRIWNLPPFEYGRKDCTMVTAANQVAVIGGVVNPSCATFGIVDKNTLDETPQ